MFIFISPTISIVDRLRQALPQSGSSFGHELVAMVTEILQNIGQVMVPVHLLCQVCRRIVEQFHQHLQAPDNYSEVGVLDAVDELAHYLQAEPPEELLPELVDAFVDDGLLQLVDQLLGVLA